jgi:hypothetical protein
MATGLEPPLDRLEQNVPLPAERELDHAIFDVLSVKQPNRVMHSFVVDLKAATSNKASSFSI